jgi:hypothetical protein
MPADSFSMEHQGGATRFPVVIELDGAAGEFGNRFPSGEAVPDGGMDFCGSFLSARVPMGFCYTNNVSLNLGHLVAELDQIAAFSSDGKSVDVDKI